MHGHQISTTRRLNKHYQSGEITTGRVFQTLGTDTFTSNAPIQYFTGKIIPRQKYNMKFSKVSGNCNVYLTQCTISATKNGTTKNYFLGMSQPSGNYDQVIIISPVVQYTAHLPYGITVTRQGVLLDTVQGIINMIGLGAGASCNFIINYGTDSQYLGNTDPQYEPVDIKVELLTA